MNETYVGDAEEKKKTRATKNPSRATRKRTKQYAWGKIEGKQNERMLKEWGGMRGKLGFIIGKVGKSQVFLFKMGKHHII